MRTQDLYQEWDTNASGSISRDEFHTAITRLGTPFPSPTVDGIFDVIVDRDPSGVLTYENLMKAIRKTKQDLQLQDAAKLQASRVDGRLPQMACCLPPAAEHLLFGHHTLSLTTDGVAAMDDGRVTHANVSRPSPPL